MMNVVWYSPYVLAADTGSGNIMLGWCEALAQQGADVTIILDEQLRSRPAPKSVHCVALEHRRGGRLRTPKGMREHLGSADVLVVQGGFVMWNIAAGREAGAAGVPYLVVPQGAYDERLVDRRPIRKRVWNMLLERRYLASALGVHVHHESELGGLRRLGVSLPAVILPNGIGAYQENRWDGGSGGYLLYLGRFDVYVKALDILVRSLTHLPERARPILRLHGPDQRGGKREVAKLVGDLGLERWIVVGEPIYGDEKWKAITQAAGCVYPSRRDAWSMAVTEAMGAGVPTLVADYPLGRLLAEEGAALLCDRTPEGVALGIERLLSEEGREAARRGASLATGRLSWDALASSWLEQVSRLLHEEGSTSGEQRVPLNDM